MSATDAAWDKVDPVRALAAGEAANGKFEVKFRKTLIKKDATIFLKVTGTAEGVSKVRVKLRARDL